MCSTLVLTSEAELAAEPERSPELFCVSTRDSLSFPAKMVLAADSSRSPWRSKQSEYQRRKNLVCARACVRVCVCGAAGSRRTSA